MRVSLLHKQITVSTHAINNKVVMTIQGSAPFVVKVGFYCSLYNNTGAKVKLDLSKLDLLVTDNYYIIADKPKPRRADINLNSFALAEGWANHLAI